MPPAAGLQALQRKDVVALHELAEVASAEASAEAKPARGKGGRMGERAAKKKSAEMEQAQGRVRLFWPRAPCMRRCPPASHRDSPMC